MKIEITLQPLFWLAFTRDELEPLFLLASHHYDGACKAAARQDGFLYGWRNIVSSRIGDQEMEQPLCSGSRRDLDTVLKICEGVRLATSCKLITEEQAATINRLCALIMTAMGDATQACHNFGSAKVNEPTQRGELQWATAPGRF